MLLLLLLPLISHAERLHIMLLYPSSCLGLACLLSVCAIRQGLSYVKFKWPLHVRPLLTPLPSAKSPCQLQSQPRLAVKCDDVRRVLFAFCQLCTWHVSLFIVAACLHPFVHRSPARRNGQRISPMSHQCALREIHQQRRNGAAGSKSHPCARWGSFW